MQITFNIFLGRPAADSRQFPVLDMQQEYDGKLDKTNSHWKKKIEQTRFKKKKFHP